MHQRRRGVSIGIPVRNGVALLPQALGSILGQTYTDFEIIISDNASDDGTEEVARDYMSRDPRVRYFRNDTNIGAVRNFNRVFALSTRRYFKWAAHDDMLLPGFLEACVATLDKDPDAALAFTRIRLIDSAGQPIRSLTDRLVRAGDPRTDLRFRDVTRPASGNFHVWGLMRSEAIAATRLYGAYPGSDRVFLAEIALQGKLVVLPEALFLLRDHPGRSVKALPTIYDRVSWHDPTRRGRALLPNWRIGLEYLRALNHVALARADRVRCYWQLAGWPARDWNWAKLALDLAAPLMPGIPDVYVRGRGWVRRRRRSARAPRDSGT